MIWLLLLMGIHEQLDAQSFLTNGLVAYYPFNGNTKDLSGNGNNGAASNVVFSIDRFGYSNSACLFNGTNSFILVKNASTLSPTGDFSVSVWIHPDSLQTLPMMVLSKSQAYNDSDSSWFISCEPSGFGYPQCVQFQANPNFGPDSPSIPFTSVGSWHHLIFTYSRTSSICASYLDGSLVDTRSENYSTNNPNRVLTIGCQQALVGYTWFFNGSIDDIRIYNRKLSAADALSLYQIEQAQTLKLNKAVWLSFSNLRNGTNYQVQVSTNLGTSFFNSGTPFTATNSTMNYPFYWNVEAWDQMFFRLQAIP